MEELFRLMETLTDEQLERVQRAEKWVRGHWTTAAGNCFVGHAEGLEYGNYKGFCDWVKVRDLRKMERLVDAYETAAEQISVRSAGRECSARAAEILAARRALKAEEVACIG